MSNLYINALGRLGNIMFQFACLMYTAKKYNKMPYIDLANAYPKNEIMEYVNIIPWFKKYTTYNIPHINNYSIENKGEGGTYIEILSNIEYIKGYRQSPKYWNNDKQFVKELFKMPTSFNTHINDLYNQDFSNIISIHIRRCDYLTLTNIYYSYSINEIQKIIKLFDNNQQFIFISDDIEWCKENFKGDNFIFADKTSNIYPKYLIDLFIQTLCKDNIISNSSFSWWGAYLNINNNRKVYYKMPWTKTAMCEDIIPENDNWINISKIINEN